MGDVLGSLGAIGCQPGHPVLASLLGRSCRECSGQLPHSVECLEVGQGLSPGTFRGHALPCQSGGDAASALYGCRRGLCSRSSCLDLDFRCTCHDLPCCGGGRKKPASNLETTHCRLPRNNSRFITPPSSSRTRTSVPVIQPIATEEGVRRLTTNN